MSTVSTRRVLLRWAGWFAAVNAGLAMLVATRYLAVYAFPPELAGRIYAIVATVGQFAALAALLLVLVLMPLVLLWPRRPVVTGTGVVLAASGLSLLVLDTNVFTQNRFHLSRLNLETDQSTSSGIGGTDISSK